MSSRTVICPECFERFDVDGPGGLFPHLIEQHPHSAITRRILDESVVPIRTKPRIWVNWKSEEGDVFHVLARAREELSPVEGRRLSWLVYNEAHTYDEALDIIERKVTIVNRDEYDAE